MATQLNRKRQVDEFWRRGLYWEEDDKLTLTQADIDAGQVVLPLSHEPFLESLQAWWHPDGLPGEAVSTATLETFESGVDGNPITPSNTEISDVLNVAPVFASANLGSGRNGTRYAAPAQNGDYPELRIYRPGFTPDPAGGVGSAWVFVKQGAGDPYHEGRNLVGLGANHNGGWRPAVTVNRWGQSNLEANDEWTTLVIQDTSWNVISDVRVAQLPVGNWYHYALTWDGPANTVTLVVTDTAGATVATKTEPLHPSMAGLYVGVFATPYEQTTFPGGSATVYIDDLSEGVASPGPSAGVDQTDYVLDVDALQITFPLTDGVEPGDGYRVRYLYRSLRPTP